MFTIVVSSRIMKKPRQSTDSTSHGLCLRATCCWAGALIGRSPFALVTRVPFLLPYPGSPIPLPQRGEQAEAVPGAAYHRLGLCPGPPRPLAQEVIDNAGLGRQV